MSKIIGQKIPLQILFNSQRQNCLPQTILIHGPDGVGKLTSAINFVKSIHCSKKIGFCNRCVSCQLIHYQRHPSLVAFLNDDRLSNIHFYIHSLKNSLSTKPKRLKNELLGELANLLRRVHNNFLSPLVREKKSYEEGIKLTEKQWETLISLGYKLFEKLDSTRADMINKDYDIQKLIETFEKIQNGLDRSLISKQMLDRFLKLSNTLSNEPKIFIIQNIDIINHQIASSLLKILEEPPANHLFILITNNLSNAPREIIAPLRSRSFELSFKKLSIVSQIKIFKDKWGINPKQINNVSLPQNMELFINSFQTKFDHDIFLDIFDEKGYNVARLYEYAKENSVRLIDITTKYRSILNLALNSTNLENSKDLTVSNYKIFSRHLNPSKILLLVSLFDKLENLSMRTNVTSANLILQLFTRMSRILNF